jgi:hypothetical protein
LQTGGLVILDESADAKAGDQSVGAARQHNGRLGKIDLRVCENNLRLLNSSANQSVGRTADLEPTVSPRDFHLACGLPKPPRPEDATAEAVTPVI